MSKTRDEMVRQLEAILSLSRSAPSECEFEMALACVKDESGRGPHFAQPKIVASLDTMLRIAAGSDCLVSVVSGKHGSRGYSFVYATINGVLIESRYLNNYTRDGEFPDVLPCHITVPTKPEMLPYFHSLDAECT